ncbi:hypothetical protein K523DRAFT_326085 [Schizophyllum commune Tattone D]|nr:hypothetical protein K523DRAFT_326085 [Schizophyllum commune Tattone D]
MIPSFYDPRRYYSLAYTGKGGFWRSRLAGDFGGELLSYARVGPRGMLWVYDMGKQRKNEMI